MPNQQAGQGTERVIEMYRAAFAAHGDTPAAVLWPKGRQALRFDALTSHIHVDGFSLLDYGCGLAHLKDYLDQRFGAYRYHGVDLVPEFIEAARTKHPTARFDLISEQRRPDAAYDHIVASGTFNILWRDDPREHRALVRETLRRLFDLSIVSLSVNFMTDRVDYRQDGAYHENVVDIYEYARDALSPRLVINQAYMPYEFTLTVLRDTGIVRPENVYRDA